MADVRISNLTNTETTPDATDFLAVDNATDGTRKILATDVVPGFDLENLSPTATATGTDSVAIGNGVTASGVESIAIGDAITANQSNAVGIGKTVLATGTEAVAIGKSVTASAAGAVAIGDQARASAAQGVALGKECTASNTDSVAIGNKATASGVESIAIGARKGTDDTLAQGANSLAIGHGTEAYSDNSIAIGEDAKAGDDTDAQSRTESTNAIAIGDNAVASGADSIAIGRGASVSTDNKLEIAQISDIQTTSFTGGTNRVIEVDSSGTWSTSTAKPYGVDLPATDGKYELNVVGASASWAAASSGGGGDSWSDAVDSNIIPDTNNSYSLGSATMAFSGAFVSGNIVVGGTVDGRDIAHDGAILDTVEVGADVTDEANVTDALDGASLTDTGTPAPNDKVLIQDTSDSDNLKTVAISALPANIADNTLTEAKLAISNSPSDGLYLQYKNSTDQLTWEAAAPYNRAVKTITGDYTATLADDIIIADIPNQSSLSITVTLPTAVGNTGKQYTVKNVDATSVTLDPNGTQTIDGATTLALGTQYDTANIVSDGANWHRID